MKAYNQIMVNREQLIADTLEVKALLTDTTAVERDFERLTAELEQLIALTNAMVKENARTAQDQESYSRRYDEAVSKYEKAKAAYDIVLETKNYKKSQGLRLDAFIETVKKSDNVLTEWTPDIWNLMLENATVHRNGKITFKFKNGQEVTV